MSLQYPLFVADTGGWVHVVSTERDLGWFEQIDIEDQEYRGWDRQGVPFDLTWSNEQGVETRAKELPAEPLNLLATLRRWAELEEVAIGSDERDPVKIAQSVDSVVKERRARTLFGRLLSLMRRRQP